MLGIGGALLLSAAVTGSRAVTAAASALALLTGVLAMVIRRPARSGAWWLLLLGSSMIVLARVTVAITNDILVIAGRLTVADIRVLVLYVAIPVGLILVGGRAARRDLADTLDASVVALGVFLLMWLFLLSGRFGAADHTVVAKYVMPVGLAVLAGILTRLIFVVERRTPSFLLLVAAIICAVAAGVVNLGHSAGYTFDARIDDIGFFFASYSVLVTAALLHPSSTARLATRQRGPSRFSATRAIVFIGLALLGPLAWVVAIVPSGFNPASVRDFGQPVIIAALITLLLLWRLALITRLADGRADELEALQAELVYRANHDPLTGLGNRSELSEKLDLLVGHPDERHRPPALLLLDLDGFKPINDSLGHPVGDELLIGVAKRLIALRPPESTVVRLGGDEFAILIPDSNEPSARAFAEMVRDQLGQPYPTSRGPLRVTASVGVCAIPRVDKSSSELLRDADLALYAAKAAGKNRVEVFAE